MAHPHRKRKCPNCNGFFYPDHRNVKRQRYCSKPACRHASRVDAQQRWRQKPDNRDYFKGDVHVQRVRLWRLAHPGYWRRAAPKVQQTSDALQDTLTSKGNENQTLAPSLDIAQNAALQDAFFMQPAVFIGLIAQLTGLALQDDIASTVRRLQQLGRDILSASTPHAAGGDLDGKTPPLHGQAALRAKAVQLGGSALGP